jgi:PAS domain S-box-containing protein
MTSPQYPETSRKSSSSDLGPDVRGEIADFVENLVEGVIFLDRQWRITYANKSARRISRIQDHHINGASHWEIYPDTVGTPQERIYRTSMEQGLSLEHEFYYPPFGVWISLNTFPIASGIAVHYRDVTRLKQAEANREESARQLQQVFDATTDAIVLLDRGYNFVFVNRRAQQLLAPSGDVLGRNLWTTYPDAIYENSPFVEIYRRAMDECLPGSFEAYYPEPLNIWMAVEARPADDGIIVFFRDVTEQRAATEELRRKTTEAERQIAEIETVYRTAPVGLALFDPVEFRYLRLNDRQAAFFGLKPEQVLGRRLTEMAPIPGLHELFEQVLAGHPVVNYPLEGELISHPGERRSWTVNYFPVIGADGSIQAISAASLEITQQKKAETALLQSEKLAAVGRLASSISHEINNPLESVTNLMYLIAADEGLPSPAKQYIDLAQAELARVSQIVTQTLRFHRQSARPSLVTAAQLVEPVLNLYKGRLLTSHIEVALKLLGRSPVHCFESEIRQVLNNLIANAIDAMRFGGTLTIRARDAIDPATGTAGICILVADTGHGMSRATMARIFEPFFSTKDLNGTGLGLWVSTEIVQRHKGRLTVRSTQDPQRHGTVFRLFLPLKASPAAAKPVAGS